MPSSPIAAAVRIQYLLDLLAQVPDPRKKRGRRHALAGLLAVGIAAVIAGSKSFAAIGQWAADAGPEALAALGSARGPADESTFRRTFSLVSADVLDRVLGAWLYTRAVRAAGRLVIASDGKTVRGAKGKDGKAPHLVAALAHGIGAVLGQVAVDEKSNEIPAVRDLLKAFASLASAVITIDARCTRSTTPRRSSSAGAPTTDDRQGQHADPLQAAQEAPLGRRPFRLGRKHGPRPPGPPHRQGGAGAVVDRVRQRRPGRAAAPHGHEEGQEDRRGRLPHHQRPGRGPRHPGRLGPQPLGDRKPPPLGEGCDLSGRQIPGQDGKRAPPVVTSVTWCLLHPGSSTV
jgi:predicted transposase YbfD/YdcC